MIRTEQRFFKKPSAIMPVSIAEQYATGNDLIRDIAFINSYGFSKVTVINTAILQRHTIKILKKCSDAEAYEIAKSSGEKWRESNKDTLDGLTIAREVLDWEHFLKDPEYPKAKERIDRLYEEDKNFKRTIDKTVGGFIARYEKEGLVSHSDLEENLELCREYLKEECAVTSMFTSYNYLLYPHKLNPAIDFICKKAQLKNIITSEAVKKMNKKGTTDNHNYSLAKKILFMNIDAILSDPELEMDSKKELVFELFNFSKQRLNIPFDGKSLSI